jgi:hypothetical protein
MAVGGELGLRSGISKKYKRAFILTPDDLTRISGAVERSAKDLGYATRVVYHVERSDDRFYETPNCEDVLADSNVADRSIKTLGIELRDARDDRPPQPWEKDQIAFVAFLKQSSNSVHIGIHHENPKWALLLADELVPLVQRTQRAKKVPTWLLASSLIALSLLVHLQLSHILALSWIPDGTLPLTRVALWISCLLLLFAIRAPRDSWVSRVFGPVCVFAWGDEADRAQAREAIRDKVFWAVIVALIVGILGNLLSFKLVGK